MGVSVPAAGNRLQESGICTARLCGVLGGAVRLPPGFCGPRTSHQDPTFSRQQTSCILLPPKGDIRVHRLWDKRDRLLANQRWEVNQVTQLC